MDTFIFDFNTDSTLTNDTNSTHSDLDWTAFQSAPPPTTNSPFSPLWSSQQDDAVAPNNRSTLVATPHDDEIYFEMEHFFNGLNQQEQLPPIQPQQQQQHHQGIIEPIHVNINVPDQIESPSRTHLSLVINEQPMSCLSTPMVPRVSSARSQCYHKLPDHAVKLMQEWYNANLDDPYPRSPDKKRFITEGNITAQQCRSWFANRRQRLKHVKRNQSKSSLSASSSSSSSSRVHHSIQTRFSELPPAEAQMLAHEHCYYCQQQQQQQQQQQITLSPSPIPLTIPTNPTTSTTTTTTLNVVINQQTVEQLIHNSLRKLLYPALM